jgi:hypothetical protein
MSVIGLGDKVEIDDGAAGAYQLVPNLVSIDAPDAMLGAAVSKRLNSGGVLTKVATVKDPGELKFTWEYDQATMTRLNNLKGVAHNFKVTIKDPANADFVRICPGFIQQNKPTKIVADEIKEIETTVMLSALHTDSP